MPTSSSVSGKSVPTAPSNNWPGSSGTVFSYTAGNMDPDDARILELAQGIDEDTGYLEPGLDNSLGCIGQAIKTEGISFGTDVLGAIPGEGQGLAIAQLTAGGVGFVNSLYHRDAGGAVGSIVGDQTVMVGMAARQLSVDALKIVPVAGNLLSGYLAVRDFIHGVGDYNNCMGGH